MWRLLLLIVVPVVAVVACSAGGLPRQVPDGGGAGAMAGTGGVAGAAGTGGMAGAAGTGGMSFAGTSGGGTTGGGGIPATGAGLEVCYSCGTEKCGNGRRDPCGGGTLPFCQTQIEACDGQDLPQTCDGLGYGSGVLSCSGACTIDDSACRECPLLPATGVAACGDAPVSVQSPAALGLAATDTEVGLAWVGLEDNDQDRRTLTFARMSSTLTLLGTTNLEDEAHTATPLPNRSIMGTSVAPLASGWVVAAAGDTEVFIHALDAQGKDLGRTSVAKVAAGFFKTFPADVTLVPRTGGGPLLIWRSEMAVQAALVAADGRSTGVPFALPLGANAVPTSAPSGVFVGDSFYVIYGIQSVGDLAPTARLVRVTTTGGVTALANHVAVGEGPTALSLAAGPNELRVTYVSGVGAQVEWTRVGLAGEELSPPATLYEPGESRRSPAVGFGDDTIVLLASAEGTSLASVRVSKTGQVMTLPAPVARSPEALASYAVVRSGPGIVAAWLATRAGATHLGLSRLVP